jgi:hypothetical protein
LVFLFPKTFRLVEVAPATATEGTTDGRTEKARVEERQTMAKSKETKKDFMIVMMMTIGLERGSVIWCRDENGSFD